MQRQVDLLILDGVVVTMDDEDRILDDGGLAIQDDRIVAVGTSGQMRERYVASRTINAGRKIVVPGLVDTYGHAGHGMIRALYHPTHGWPMMDLYWHHTTEHWWYAEALLAATERLRFGVTTGASIIGAATRADSPVFGIRNAEAYAKVGIRAVLGVGPPDPIVSSLPKPWSGSHYEDGKWVRREFTYQEALSNSLQVIESWHGGADGRIRVALAASALFGRRVFHGRPKYDYQPSDVPIMIDKAEELRDLADRYRVQIHTHMFEGSVDFALQHFGLGRVQVMFRDAHKVAGDLDLESVDSVFLFADFVEEFKIGIEKGCLCVKNGGLGQFGHPNHFHLGLCERDGRVIEKGGAEVYGFEIEVIALFGDFYTGALEQSHEREEYACVNDVEDGMGEGDVDHNIMVGYRAGDEAVDEPGVPPDPDERKHV